MLKYDFVVFSGRIGKEVEYVIHGIEELSSHLIMKLKKLRRKDIQKALSGTGSRKFSVSAPNGSC